MARFEIPDGWTAQAFQFTLDLTDAQAGVCGVSSEVVVRLATGLSPP